MAKLTPDAPTNHRVYTPPLLAAKIVGHFKPSGSLFDPCRGKGAFTGAMGQYARYNPGRVSGIEWCEIDEGRDYLNTEHAWCDWNITNPPWGRKLFLPFLVKAMSHSSNIVFLSLAPNYFQTAKVNAMVAADFTVAEIAYVKTYPAGWPKTGFALAAVHLKYCHTGGIKESEIV